MCLPYSERLKCLKKDHIKYGLNMESMQNYQSKNKDRLKDRKTEEFILEENASEKEKKVSHRCFMP